MKEDNRQIDALLNALRKEMKTRGMDAYVIPTEDYHSSEYVGEYFKAREYMSGFTGSAGTLVVLADHAALWTDGRYFLQAEEQLKSSEIELMRSGQPGVLKISEYLYDKLPVHGTIGFDGRTVSNRFVLELEKASKEKEFCFAGEEDLVDLVWKNRPPLSKEPVWELKADVTGMERKEKIRLVREEMTKQGTDVLLVTALDEIAWLLNLRGADVAYTPVFLSYLLIGQEEAKLCVEPSILSPSILEHLQKDGIEIHPYFAIDSLLQSVPANLCIWVDEEQVNYHLTKCIPEEVRRVNRTGPIVAMKAKKTPQEIENIRNAHRKDGVAVTKFLYWLKHNVGRESITERQAAEKLLAFRKEMDGFLDQSFEPIIAYGEHGAIVHYSATNETDAILLPKGLCLADTGGHYMDGTTDVTRTIVLGKLTKEEKKAFTLVLKGNLNLGAAVFMKGCQGQNLDYIARKPLWEHHMDFNHGTGHGVGFLLNVHEGPQRIHWRITKESAITPFEEGMLVSNEPGLYLAGKFGVRHENLMLCCEDETNEYGTFLRFETLTMIPFDREGIEPAFMTKEEIALLNQYHERVYESLVPFLTLEEAKWLKGVTAPIA